MRKINHRKNTKSLNQFDSSSYWEERYNSGRNSGPGSYGRLAVFKASFLNDFVVKNEIESVIEWGCGDGNQLKLAKYSRYLGLDVSQSSIRKCIETFKKDSSKSFIHYSNSLFNDSAGFVQSDLALSLDVVFHLVEDEVFDNYMKLLFSSAKRFVIIYSSNRLDSNTAEHVKHRKFTDWTARNVPDWKLIEKVPNKFPFSKSDPDNTSFSDFYIYSINY